MEAPGTSWEISDFVPHIFPDRVWPWVIVIIPYRVLPLVIVLMLYKEVEKNQIVTVQ